MLVARVRVHVDCDDIREIILEALFHFMESDTWKNFTEPFKNMWIFRWENRIKLIDQPCRVLIVVSTTGHMYRHQPNVCCQRRVYLDQTFPFPQHLFGQYDNQRHALFEDHELLDKVSMVSTTTPERAVKYAMRSPADRITSPAFAPRMAVMAAMVCIMG
mmetsp:Transcript_15552/g.39019  ORF Transcript_15552/g.39019 Transcript_15552/m.39019 type:complete len:160 (-) Transcript_15552:804-1283(-)